ncbi:unnamed protein product [Callosobruchus maculatus]|uniref:Uncharacterized protein n=1 Tax=Callosobruchus maculatus TaxID=64391 RepID=A0A653C0Z7_CALMS|nr:unnamed protein product [Callosobruchus maculatus]
MHWMNFPINLHRNTRRPSLCWWGNGRFVPLLRLHQISRFCVHLSSPTDTCWKYFAENRLAINNLQLSTTAKTTA